MNRRRTSALLLLVAVLVTSLLPMTVLAQTTPMPNMGNAPFTELWARTDYPVLDGKVQRSYYFGPSVLLSGQEAYKESPGGTRYVAYLDKARLELTDPVAGTVTAGLLAKELISGKMQVGNAEYRSYEPAAVPVAGDPVESNAPTYASFLGVSSIEPSANRAQPKAGQPVTEVLNRSGAVGTDASLTRYGVTLKEYRDELGHNIPNVFVDFFAQRGLVATITDEGVVYSEEQLINWVAVMGLPLAEPYWAVVPVAGAQHWVLMQPFERRVVTYTPDNSEAFRVEMGNIGQHYKLWRHPDGTMTDRPLPQPTQPPTTAPRVPPAPATNTLSVEVFPISGTANDEFVFIVAGWTPGEPLAFWFTDPRRTVWYPRERQVSLPKEVEIYFISVVPSEAFRTVTPGIWAFTAQGVNSGKKGIIYFEIT